MSERRRRSMEGRVQYPPKKKPERRHFKVLARRVEFRLEYGEEFSLKKGEFIELSEAEAKPYMAKGLIRYARKNEAGKEEFGKYWSPLKEIEYSKNVGRDYHREERQDGKRQQTH